MVNEFNTELLTDAQTCPAVGYQSASICVPVTVTPFAQTGVTVTKCCGDPVVTPGREVCGGIKNGSCFFTITQDICVAVPSNSARSPLWETPTSTATALPRRTSAPTARISSPCPPSPLWKPEYSGTPERAFARPGVFGFMLLLPGRSSCL